MNTANYQGPLAEYIDGLLQHKRALGYHYDTPARARLPAHLRGSLPEGLGA